MKKMAEAIESEGAIPGLWLRPLWTVEKYPRDHIIKRKGIKDTLDPSHPEVLKLIKRDIETIRNWGYKLIKHDFTTFDIFGRWGFEMTEDMFRDEIVFFDRSKTTAQIIKQLYMTIREAAGDDVLIIGCNTLSHLAAGIFEIQRTGDDTSGKDFERTKKYGINTLAFRRDIRLNELEIIVVSHHHICHTQSRHHSRCNVVLAPRTNAHNNDFSLHHSDISN